MKCRFQDLENKCPLDIGDTGNRASVSILYYNDDDDVDQVCLVLFFT